MATSDPPTAEPAVTAADQYLPGDGSGASGDLRRRVLPLWAVYAMAIAVNAPTGSVALGVPGVSSAAGNATWLSFAIVTIGVLGVAYCISFTARRFASAGGLYGLASGVAGRGAGYVQGIPQLMTLLVTLPLCIFGSGIYLASAVSHLGIADTKVTTLACYAAVIVVGGYTTLRDIRVSTKALLILEGVSLVFVMCLFVIVLARHHGGLIDHAQLSLKGTKVHGVLLSFAFALFTIAGFENAAVLGKEAREPKRDIPKAILGSVGILGILFVISSYIQVLGLPSGALAASPAPLNELATLAHVGWFGWIIDLCVAVSFFSALLGCMNGTARIFFALGRDGVLASRFGRADRHGQPRLAIVGMLGYVALLVLILGLISGSQIQAYVDLGTLIGYFLFVVYLAAIAMALILAVRQRTGGFVIAAAALVGAGTLLNGLYFTFVPWPVGAAATLFWTFLGTVIVATVLAIYGKSTGARWWQAIGTSSLDEE